MTAAASTGPAHLHDNLLGFFKNASTGFDAPSVVIQDTYAMGLDSMRTALGPC